MQIPTEMSQLLRVLAWIAVVVLPGGLLLLPLLLADHVTRDRATAQREEASSTHQSECSQPKRVSRTLRILRWTRASLGRTYRNV